MREEERVSALLRWHSSKLVALNQSDIPVIADAICRSACEVESDDTTNSRSGLSSAQQSDARAVTSGLLAVYGAYSAESQLKFWQDRGLELNPIKIAEMRSSMRSDPGASSLHVDQMAPDELFRAFFKLAGLSAHWQAVAVDVSCTAYWSAAPTSAVFEGLGARENLTFSNLNTYHAFFQPKTSEPRKSPSSPPTETHTTFLDVKIVVQYDATKSRSFAPYFVRFWWDNDRLKWQPLLMTSVASDSQTPPRIIF